LEKLLNEPFYKEWSYFKFAFRIIERAEVLVEKQLEVQKNTTPEDPVYFDNVKLISDSICTVREAWRHYSPDMANASITIAGQKDVALWPTVYGYTKDEIVKLDLPPSLKWLKSTKKNESGGCFGIILALVLMPLSLILMFMLKP
jgi:hypothetical protein